MKLPCENCICFASCKAKIGKYHSVFISTVILVECDLYYKHEVEHSYEVVSYKVKTLFNIPEEL